MEQYQIPKVRIGFEPATDEDTLIVEIIKGQNDIDLIVGKIIGDGNSYITLDRDMFKALKYGGTISEGGYKARFWVSPKFGDVIRLEDKHGQSNILVHQGNYPRHTQGCILVGDMPGKTTAGINASVLQSKMAKKNLIAAARKYSDLLVVVKEDYRFEYKGGR